MIMKRTFIKSAAAAGTLGLAGTPLEGAPSPGKGPHTGTEDRHYWVSIVDKISRPVLENLANRTLRKNMPVEQQAGSTRERVCHLEAFGRLLYGIAPWLAAKGLTGPELELQKHFQQLARTALDHATHPESPDYMNFSVLGQPLVDTAFLAQGILRAPAILWDPLEPRVKKQVITAFKLTRQLKPHPCNWVMFAATVESALLEFGEPTLEERLETYVRDMLGWYCGDGVYGDGEFFHFDYYNSFVIHPMLVDVLATLVKHDGRFSGAHDIVMQRAARYAEIQERFIAPDGTFPPVGRSLTYRMGAFQTLALMAWQHGLPEAVKPAQVRCALTATIRRTMDAPGTFDEGGWLRIGLCGHQLEQGEVYITTGSVYLCSAGLLPLGLPPSDPFWSAPAERWTSQKLWSGESLPADHAIKDVRKVDVPTLKRPG